MQYKLEHFKTCPHLSVKTYLFSPLSYTQYIPCFPLEYKCLIIFFYSILDLGDVKLFRLYFRSINFQCLFLNWKLIPVLNVSITLQIIKLLFFLNQRIRLLIIICIYFTFLSNNILEYVCVVKRRLAVPILYGNMPY